jgi:hypothetical protein
MAVGHGCFLQESRSRAAQRARLAKVKRALEAMRAVGFPRGYDGTRAFTAYMDSVTTVIGRSKFSAEDYHRAGAHLLQAFERIDREVDEIIASGAATAVRSKLVQQKREQLGQDLGLANWVATLRWNESRLVIHRLCQRYPLFRAIHDGTVHRVTLNSAKTLAGLTLTEHAEGASYLKQPMVDAVSLLRWCSPRAHAMLADCKDPAWSMSRAMHTDFIAEVTRVLALVERSADGDHVSDKDWLRGALALAAQPRQRPNTFVIRVRKRKRPASRGQ